MDYSEEIRLQRKIRRIVLYIIIFIVSVWVLHPFAWMILSSVTPEYQMYSRSVRIPTEPTLNPYFWVLNLGNFMTGPDARIFAQTAGTIDYGRFYFNTFVPAFASALFVAFITLYSGWYLARQRSQWLEACGTFYLTMQFLPPILIAIPWYIMFNQMGILDSYFALFLVYSVSSIPWGVWMVRAFVLTIPRDLEEAALIDGCNRFQMIYKVILPLIAPGFVAVILFTFTTGWNAYLAPLILCSSEETKPIAIGISELYSWYGRTYWGGMMALCVITTIPVSIAFVYLQKYLVQGLTAGAIKG